MAVVRLPSILAREAGGPSSFETDAGTLREALRGLPVADLLFDQHGELRPLVNVYVDGDDARSALDAPLAAAATVRIVAAVAGGAETSRRTRPGDMSGFARHMLDPHERRPNGRV